MPSVPPQAVTEDHSASERADQWVWRQTVDTVDDFFRIAKEQPVRSGDPLLIDGRLETAYKIGGGIFEPWRTETTGGYQKLESTLQSIRRRAIVTVRPAIASTSSPTGLQTRGYIVEVVVTKDLEDVDRPQGTTAAPTVTRHDGTLIRTDDRYDDSPITLGWIPLGRDTELEQRILAQITERLQNPDADGPIGKWLHR